MEFSGLGEASATADKYYGAGVALKLDQHTATHLPGLQMSKN